VECTTEQSLACQGETPACDAVSGTCVRCTAHDQCGADEAAACNILDGTCFASDPEQVHHVGEVQEFTTIGAALAMVQEGDQAVVVLHGASSSFNEAVVLAGDRTVAFKNPEGVLWIQANTGEEPTLAVADGAVVYLDHMMVTGNLLRPDTFAIELANATLLAQHSRIGLDLLNGGSIWADREASLIVDRSRIVNSDHSGVRATDGTNAKIVNSFVLGGNIVSENETALVGSITVVDATLELVYSSVGSPYTVAALLDETSPYAPALQCAGASGVSVRNSLLMSYGLARDCPGAPIRDSFIGVPTSFVDYLDGDLWLELDHPYAGIAVWQEGDPLTDIDGDPRPTTQGSFDIAGADIPVGL